jgi:hypothetical protein
VIDESFEDTERRVRAAMRELGESHQPDTEGRWPASHPRGERRPVPPSSTRRWMLVAASFVVVLAGIAAVVAIQGNDGDPATDPAPPPTAPEGERTDDPQPTTAPTAPPESVPATVPAEELTGVRFPVGAAEQDAGILPWRDGFLAVTVEPLDEPDGEATLTASFTTDGSSWEPVEVTTPPGMQNPGRITAVGDRLAMADSLSTADGGVVVRVASTTDLLEWSLQDFELPGARPNGDMSQLGVWWPSMRSFAMNETGWVFEIARMYFADVTTVLPGDVQRDLAATGYRVRSDDTGFSVAVNGPDGSPPTPESTFTYTWDEVGVAAEDVPYLTGETLGQTWAAAWDGTPTLSASAIDEGPTLASTEGFVRWNDRTWFSPDGITWSSSPLPDPTGTVTNAFPVDGGFVAVVANQRGTSDVYRLDERGGNARLIPLSELPEQFLTGFADRTLLAGLDSAMYHASNAVLLDAGMSSAAQTPLVIDGDGYRYIERRGLTSVVDLATGEVVVSFARDRPPVADIPFVFGDDGLTVTDTDTETVLMRIPVETFRAAQDDRVARAGSTEIDEAVSDLRMLASRDGEQFRIEPLRPSDPDTDAETTVVRFATNGGVLLARLGNEWVRYDLP